MWGADREGVTGIFLTVSSPAAVSLEPCLAPRFLTMKPIQRNRKCLPLAGAQSKPSLFPCKNFDRKRLLRKYASCAGSVVLLSYRSCLFFAFFFFFLPPLLFLSSAAANKGTHRPVPTTCEARRHCCVLTRQARHRAPWACLVIVRAVKSGSPAASAPAPPPPILNRAIVFSKLSGCAITDAIACVHVRAHSASPAEGTSVSTPLRLLRKRRVQVKPNICQMLLQSHQEVSPTLGCCW